MGSQRSVHLTRGHKQCFLVNGAVQFKEFNPTNGQDHERASLHNLKQWSGVAVKMGAKLKLAAAPKGYELDVLDKKFDRFYLAGVGRMFTRIAKDEQIPTEEIVHFPSNAVASEFQPEWSQEELEAGPVGDHTPDTNGAFHTTRHIRDAAITVNEHLQERADLQYNEFDHHQLMNPASVPVPTSPDLPGMWKDARYFGHYSKVGKPHIS